MRTYLELLSHILGLRARVLTALAVGAGPEAPYFTKEEEGELHLLLSDLEGVLARIPISEPGEEEGEDLPASRLKEAVQDLYRERGRALSLLYRFEEERGRWVN